MSIFTFVVDRMRVLTSLAMSRCRVCGSSKDVAMYDPRGLWAYPIRKTWCPAHCPDHDYIYCRSEGHYCGNCGQQPDAQWYDDRAAAMAEAEAESFR